VVYEVPIPALVAPVPPQSTMSPTIKASSVGAYLRSWYWNVVSRSANPAWVGAPGVRIWVQVSAISTPKSAVMRLEISASMSTSFPAGEPMPAVGK
jgi:hypothetical protein